MLTLRRCVASEHDPLPFLPEKPKKEPSLACLDASSPPTRSVFRTAGLSRYFLKLVMHSCVCSAKSLAGSRMTDLGSLLPL